MDKEAEIPSCSLTINSNKLKCTEERNNFISTLKKDIFNLFDEICDIIIEEKGQLSEDEIQQLVEMLRNKIKNTQNNNKDNLQETKNDESEEMKLNSSTTITLDADIFNPERTRKTLQVITDKMSDYIIQEKGEIIEQDILDIANQLRQFSSVTIADKACRSSNQLCKLDLQKTEPHTQILSTPNSLKSSSNGNIHFKKFIESNNTINTSFYSCISFNNECQNDNVKSEGHDKKELKTSAASSTNLNRNIKSRESIIATQSTKKLNISAGIPKMKDTLPHSNKSRIINNSLFNQKQTNELKTTSKNYKQTLSIPNKTSLINNMQGINELINFNHSLKKEKHLNLSAQSADCHKEDVLQNNRKVRSTWKLKKNNIIVLKTTNYINSVISIEEKCSSQQETTTDVSEKIAGLFSKVIDVILEKFNIRGEDVENIANLMLQNEKEKTPRHPRKEFIAITPDIPRWALRGFLSTASTELPSSKLVSSLLNKVAEYIAFKNGKILQSDRAKFCAILGKKLLHQIYPKDIKNHLGISQKHKRYLKTKKSELRINSAKFCEIKTKKQNTEDEKDKKTVVSHKKETSSLGGLIKNVKAVDVKQTLSIDAAIEEGIRSLEYIKQLSERLLSDFDDNTELKNENLKKRLPIQLKISRNLPVNKSLQFQNTNVEYNKARRKLHSNDKKVQDCTNFLAKNHQTNLQSRNCSLRSTVEDQKVDVVKINKSKTSVIGNSNYHKSEQINRIVKIQSDNEHYGKNELQFVDKEFSQSVKSRRNCSTPLLRCKTDVKHYIKTSRAVCRSVEVNNYSRLINQQIRSDLQNDIGIQKGNFTKHNKNNNEQKKHATFKEITNQFGSYSDTSDEGKPKKSISQEVILKVSRTYSVFKPILSESENNNKVAHAGFKCYQSNNSPQEKTENRLLKRTENFTNFVKDKYFNSKIPVRTIHLSRGISLSEK